MDKAKIIEGLQKALMHGEGSLDDLNKLLKRAQEDVEAAKREEAEAAKKKEAERGNLVAEIATRLLNSELTDADMAFIMNVFFEQHKLQGIWTAENINALIKSCDDQVRRADRIVKQTDEAINRLADLLSDIGIDINVNTDKNTKAAAQAKKPPEKDPDDVIADFLKKFGL